MSQTPKKGLGRGLGSLISADFDKTIINPGDKVARISVNSLIPSPYQPRKHFDNNSLGELADSIKRHGVVQPLIVTPESKGKYTLIAGERRWRASKIAKIKEVPVIIRDSKQLEQLEIALIENVQRIDLNPLEQAFSIEQLREQFSLTYEDIAKRLGKAPSTISNIVRLLKLPDSAQQALQKGTISEGHARAILSIKNDPSRQKRLVEVIVSRGLSVRQAEQFASSLKTDNKEVKRAIKRTENQTPATKALGKKLSTQVTLRRTAKGGKLEIAFSDETELKRIIGLL